MDSDVFDIGLFSSVSFTPRMASRNFPLQVEGYDTSGNVHFVIGLDLSSGAEKKRVRVFLREMKKDAPGHKNRPRVIHYATDVCAGLTEADYKDREKMEHITGSLEAKCYTAPGGVLMVQAAYDDATVGAVSANWLNRVVSNNSELQNGTAVLLSPATARLSTPVFPREGDTGTTYCYCDVLHTAAATIARSAKAFDEELFRALSVSPSLATGKFLAAVRLVDKATGRHSTKLLERRAEKIGDTYTNESPATAIDRFWEALTDDYAAGMKAALNKGGIEIIVIPVTRYRLVGKTLASVELSHTKRMHLPYERFAMENQPNGFLDATVVLRRFKGDGGQVEGDEDYFITAVYPMTTGNKPVSLNDIAL